MDTIKHLEIEIEKLKCGLVCEKEQNTTLGIEQSTVKAELQKAKNENTRLLEELRKAMQESQTKVRR